MSRSRSGLTIIEVLIALAIIGALLAVVAVTQVSTFRITTKSQKASIATQAAIKEMTSISTLVLGVHTDTTQTPSTVSNFPAFYNGNCSGTVVACSGSLTDLPFAVPSGVQGTYTISGPTGTPGYGQKGFVTIEVTIQKPAALTMATHASCVDQQLYPTVLDPTSCEF